MLKEAEKKEAEVRKVMKENVEADAAHKIEERLDEVKAMIGKVTAKSGEVKELVQPKAEEGKGEVLASKYVNVAEAESRINPEKSEVKKKAILEKDQKGLGKAQKKGAVLKVAVEQPEVKKQEAIKVKEGSEPDVKKSVEHEDKEGTEKSDVPESKKGFLSKLGIKKEATKAEVKEAVKMPEVKEAMERPEVEEVVKPEAKEAVKKLKVEEVAKEAVEKSDVKEAVKAEVQVVQKSEVGEVVKEAVNPEVKEVVAIEKLEVKEAVKVEVQVAKKLLDVKELKEEMEKEKVKKAEAADKVAAWRSRICLAATYHRLVNDQGCRKTFSHGDSGERP